MGHSYKVYYSDCSGNPKNCYYPNAGESSSAEELKAFLGKDHVFIQFKDNYRSKSNFVSADSVVFDCDNGETDDEKAWIYPEDIKSIFMDIPCVISTSRNHMKQKGDKSPRPRFHVVFPVCKFTDAEEYTGFMRKVQRSFPFFDGNALDAARFFFGNPDTEVTVVEGNTLLSDLLIDEQDDARVNELQQLVDKIISEGPIDESVLHSIH